MKKAFIVCTFIILATNAMSQTNIYNRKPWDDWKKHNLSKDTLFQAFSAPRLKAFSAPKFQHSLPSPAENNPAIVVIKLKGKYLRKNGAGSDVYAMQPYNMPCITPDSSFASHTPVALKRENGISLNR